MAMKQLIEGECGGANPLMSMASHFTQDKARHQDRLHADNWQFQAEQRRFEDASEQELVREYLQRPNYYDAPQTFRMDKLLSEMHEMHEQMSGPLAMQPIHRDPRSDAWVDEFLPLHSAHENEVSGQWIDEFARHQVAQIDDQRTTNIAADLVAHDKWAHEYLDHAVSNNLNSKNNDSLQQTAQEILDKVYDDEIRNTQFMKTVENLSKGGELDDKENLESKDEDWAEEFQKQNSAVAVDAEAQKWIDEYSLNENDVDYWRKLQSEWDEIASDDVESDHPWLEQYREEYKKDYTFEEDNPFKDHPNAFQDGLEKLKQGDLISAILLFEEAVRADPEHAEAWQYLGTSQAENEQEMLAISALNKCAELQPDNLTARMALAVSYTNESMQYQACESLKEWLRHHPRYKDLIAREDTQARANTRVSSLMSKEDFDKIHDLFIAAAQRSLDGNLDAEVQVGLGILFNLSGDYQKAVDCFKTGLQTKPSDPYIWNKLGATLANSGRSEEAVEAYRNALELNPAFIRARYNLGISCVNLGAHVEAIEHFLTALNMQRKGENPSGIITTMSDNIWSTLRMSISLVGRSELLPDIERRNLDRLNKEFNMHE